jgi:hypothetical protein
LSIKKWGQTGWRKQGGLFYCKFTSCKIADEAVWIGESPSNQSYLLGDKIIEV